MRLSTPRIFQIVVLIFVILFSLFALALVLSGIFRSLWMAGTDRGGVFATSGGFSFSLPGVKLILVVVGVALISFTLAWRRFLK